MKVCRIVDSFPTGKEIVGDLGPNFYYYSKASVDAGIEDHIICIREKGQPKYEEIEGIKVHRVASQADHGRRDLLFGDFAKKSFEKVLEIKPDIVHGHNSFHFSCCRKKDKLKKKGIKIVTHRHGPVDDVWYKDYIPLSYNFRKALRDRFVDLTLFAENLFVQKKSDYILTIDNQTNRSIKKYFPNKYVKTIYNGVDIKRFKRIKTDIKDSLDADYLILNVGRPAPYKGIQYLIPAAKKLGDIYPNLKCICVGSKRSGGYKPYSDWLEHIRKKENADNVELWDRMPYFDLCKYYSAADCFVMPSFREASVKTMYEAEACDCPVAATKDKGVPEVFNKNCGLLFKPRNVDDIVEKTSIVIDNPNKFNGGRELVKNNFTWKKCQKELVGFYDSIFS